WIRRDVGDCLRRANRGGVYVEEDTRGEQCAGCEESGQATVLRQFARQRRRHLSVRGIGHHRAYLVLLGGGVEQRVRADGDAKASNPAWALQLRIGQCRVAQEVYRAEHVAALAGAKRERG